MTINLTTVLLIFLVGFALHRHRTVLIGIVAALLVGVLVANTWFGDVVHHVDGVFRSIT